MVPLKSLADFLSWTMILFQDFSQLSSHVYSSDLKCAAKEFLLDIVPGQEDLLDSKDLTQERPSLLSLPGAATGFPPCCRDGLSLLHSSQCLTDNPGVLGS